MALMRADLVSLLSFTVLAASLVMMAMETLPLEDGPEKGKALETALEYFAYLKKKIKGKKFFGGDKIGYLDLVASWIPHFLSVLAEARGMKILDAERFSFLHEWAQSFNEIMLIKECLPHSDMLLNYITARLSY